MPAGEVSLAAKRRHLDRARREAFEQEEIDRLAEQARKEKVRTVHMASAAQSTNW